MPRVRLRDQRAEETIEQGEMGGKAQSLQSVLMDLNFCNYILFATVVAAL